MLLQKQLEQQLEKLHGKQRLNDVNEIQEIEKSKQLRLEIQYEKQKQVQLEKKLEQSQEQLKIIQLKWQLEQYRHLFQREQLQVQQLKQQVQQLKQQVQQLKQQLQPLQPESRMDELIKAVCADDVLRNQNRENEKKWESQRKLFFTLKENSRERKLTPPVPAIVIATTSPSTRTPSTSKRGNKTPNGPSSSRNLFSGNCKGERWISQSRLFPDSSTNFQKESNFELIPPNAIPSTLPSMLTPLPSKKRENDPMSSSSSRNVYSGKRKREME